jgi:type I restriction enzyme M protein
MLQPPLRPPAKRSGGYTLSTEAATEPVTPAIGPFIARALADRRAILTHSDPATKVHYVDVGVTQRFSQPEEQVRADFWAELIYRYGYDPVRIGIEVTIPDRQPKDRADLVVFHDDDRTRPFAVIECKRDGIRDVEFDQAVEQAIGNGTWSKLRASYVGVVAGITRRFLDVSGGHGILERESNVVADLPAAYGRPLEYKYTKNGKLDLRPVTKDELITTLAKCHQTLWGGGRLSPPAAFGELCKLIFVKLHDEAGLRAVGKPYDFQLRTGETTKQLGERIRMLYLEQQKREPEVFTDPIRVDDTTLRALVSHLEPINLSATDLDVKGVAFERFMDGFFKGDFGQYFTPREVIRLAVDLIEPTEHDLIADPACGSAGFLLYALDAVRSHVEAVAVNELEAFQHWSKFAQRNLYGVEINDELTRVAKMNMIIHGDGHTNIINDDSLRPTVHLHTRNRGFGLGKFDVVLTNPPFGATVSSSTHPNMAEFALGTTDAGKPRSTQKTEILFVERVYDLLKPGTGRAAIVLPDGVLSNKSTKYVRDFIFKNFQVLAVISLPATAFAHYGAAVKSSVVLLRRRGRDEKPAKDELIFMAAPEFIGYDATGRATDNQLPQVVEDYRRFLDDPSSLRI